MSGLAGHQVLKKYRRDDPAKLDFTQSGYGKKQIPLKKYTLTVSEPWIAPFTAMTSRRQVACSEPYCHRALSPQTISKPR